VDGRESEVWPTTTLGPDARLGAGGGVVSGSAGRIAGSWICGDVSRIGDATKLCVLVGSGPDACIVVRRDDAASATATSITAQAAAMP
jgi:hypothetical protein